MERASTGIRIKKETKGECEYTYSTLYTRTKSVLLATRGAERAEKERSPDHPSGCGYLGIVVESGL
jgi:hypothetical protein